MKLVDAVNRGDKEVIMPIIVELVERDLLGINIKLDQMQTIDPSEIIKALHESFIANLIANEDKIKLREI